MWKINKEIDGLNSELTAFRVDNWKDIKYDRYKSKILY